METNEGNDKTKPTRRPSTSSQQRQVGEALLNGNGLLRLYARHFFPHINVDLLRLRFITRSLLRRASSELRAENERNDPDGLLRGMCALISRNKHRRKYQDGLSMRDYASLVMVHLCEYVVCKAEAILYESTTAEDVAIRAWMKKGARDVSRLEILLLRAVRWHVYKESLDEVVHVEAAAPEDDAFEEGGTYDEDATMVLPVVRLPRLVTTDEVLDPNSVSMRCVRRCQRLVSDGLEQLHAGVARIAATTTSSSAEEEDENTNKANGASSSTPPAPPAPSARTAPGPVFCTDPRPSS